jgi:U6 snRNA-associated Sm-like protein LSm7
VKLNGGREVAGILKGYDTLFNLVLDDATEFIRDSEDPTQRAPPDDGEYLGREIGVCVVRGPLVVRISPMDGTDEIENPFIAEQSAI